jgi:hypothetical protein
MHHSAHPIMQSVVKSVAINSLFSARFASLRCIPSPSASTPITYFDQTTKQNPENLYSAFFTSQGQSSFAHSSNRLRSPYCCVPAVLSPPFHLSGSALTLSLNSLSLNSLFTPIGQSPSPLSLPTPRTSFL